MPAAGPQLAANARDVRIPAEAVEPRGDVRPDIARVVDTGCNGNQFPGAPQLRQEGWRDSEAGGDALDPRRGCARRAQSVQQLIDAPPHLAVELRTVIGQPDTVTAPSQPPGRDERIGAVPQLGVGERQLG